MTNEYTYLGLKMTPNNKFCLATKQLSEKSLHALFKIRKHLDIHKVNPKIAMKIFDGIVSPILLYNSEIWGAYVNKAFMKWDNTPTENAHLKFCKLYLGVNRKSSNRASRGELGKFPLLIPIFKLFTYINHITKLPESNIAKQAFSLSKRLYLNNQESFYSNVVNIIKQFYPDIKEPIDIEQFIKYTTINEFIQNAKNNYILFWKQQIENCTKLSFYGSFKQQYKLGEYLNIIKEPSQRRIFSKFRISNHKLEIEFGRYKTIRREERICKNCDSSKVEDEFHFLFECKKYEDLRNDSQNILKQYFQMDISNDSKKKLLNKIMSLNDPVIIDILSSHISKCFHVRDKSP